MQSVSKAASAAALVTLIVALAGCSPAGATGSTSTPKPSASPPPSPTAVVATSAPSASIDPTVIEMGSAELQLPAGTYLVDDPRRPFTVTLPATWTLQTAQLSGLAMYRTEPDSFAPTLVIDRINDVFADPCHPEPAPPRAMNPFTTRPMVVEGLRSMTGFTAGPATEVTLGGHPATTFVLTNDLTDVAASACSGSPLDLWEGALGRQATNQRARDHIWVVDLNGIPITIDAQSLPGLTPDELVAELEHVVASINYIR